DSDDFNRGDEDADLNTGRELFDPECVAAQEEILFPDDGDTDGDENGDNGSNNGTENGSNEAEDAENGTTANPPQIDDPLTQ
ncbi:MAG: hypothetical protein OER96_13465, partial [Gammaproteobacteria bacterium]|nr:hypothetical protein [Gammaproteobacteria bacterium]